MTRLLDALLARPRSVVLAVTLIAALAAITVAHTRDDQGGILRVDASFEALLPAGSDDARTMARIERLFGASDPLLVAVTLPSLMSRDGLQTVEQLHDAFRKLDGVDSVDSLASVGNLLRNHPDDDVLDVGPVTRQVAREPDALQAIIDSARRNPMLAGVFFNHDTDTAAFLVHPAGDGDPIALAQAVREVLAETAGVDAFAMTGNALVNSAITDAIWQSLIVILPVAVVLVVTLLAFAFRSALVVVLGALSIGVSLLVMWAVGAMAGMSLNLVSAIAPPVVVAFGIMFNIHMVSEWLRQDVGEEPQRARRAVGAVAVPLLLNGLTTTIGLAALSLSPLPAVRDFSLLAVTGVVSLTLLSVSYLPALLLLMGEHLRPQTLPGEALTARCAKWLAHFDVRWRRAIVLLAAFAVLAGLAAAQRIEAGSSYIGNFRADAPVRVDYEAVNTRLGGASAMTVLLEAPLDNALLEPELALAVDDFVLWLRAQPEIAAVASYVDHLKVLNAAMQPSAEGKLIYPDSMRTARQLLAFAGSDAINGLIDARQRNARLQIRTNVEHSARVSDLLDRMETRMATLPGGLRAEVTGAPVLAARTVTRVVDRQWLSVAVALLAILGVLYALFLSLRAAIIAMLPNLLPVAVYFGLLGVTGIGLNPATSLVACLVIGVAVDDTIHFLARFNSEARARGSEDAAVAHALGTILRPVTLTTAALCLSFLAFSLSPLTSQVQFGLLAAGALLLAWLTDIFLTPALGSMVRIVTLWDLLRVDLGHSPQMTVPLLNGLSNRQARLFALTARYETVPSGIDIMREGEVSSEICVCIDGQLEVWVARDDERKVINCLFRGATLGEAGYFGQKRTATVTTKNEARLLRFDAGDLERLRRRHPRIAAIVLRNLNRIQAERLVHATAMLR